MNEGKLCSFKSELSLGGFFPFRLIELQRNYGGYQEYQDKNGDFEQPTTKALRIHDIPFKRPILLAEFEL